MFSGETNIEILVGNTRNCSNV